MLSSWGDDVDENDTPQTGGSVPEEGSLSNISDENLDILKSLDESQPTANAGKKGKKDKKDKKEKKEKPPKEKKEKKPKEKKEKKPKEKKPKEPMQPVPKAPLILCIVLGLSLTVLIMVFVKFSGGQRTISAARRYFSRGDYILAYETIVGYPDLEDDDELKREITLMALIVQQRDSFYYLQAQGLYEDALDALIRGVYRYDKYVDEAASYGLGTDYMEIENEIEKRLGDTFKLTKEKARELYSIDDRQEYTDQVYKIVRDLGYRDTQEQ